MNHDQIIVVDANGMPLVSDVSKTVQAHRAALERMRDHAETLAALHPEHAPRMINIARGYDMLRTRLNSVGA